MKDLKQEIISLMKYLGVNAVKFSIDKDFDRKISNPVFKDYMMKNMGKQEQGYWDRTFILENIEQFNCVYYCGNYYNESKKVKAKKAIEPTLELLKELVRLLRLKVRTKAMAKAIKTIAVQELKYSGITIPDDEMRIPFVIYEDE